MAGNIEVWPYCDSKKCTFTGIDCSYCGHKATDEEIDRYKAARERLDKRRGPGAPPLPPGQRKVKVGLRLHPWFMDLLRAETSGKGTQSQAELIEKAVCKYKDWSAPE